MDLTARKKNQKKEVELQVAKEPSQSSHPEVQDTYTHTIQMQCNTLLYTTLQNMIKSMQTANDFSYTSVADVIRASVQAYKNGMELTELEICF